MNYKAIVMLCAFFSSSASYAVEVSTQQPKSNTPVQSITVHPVAIPIEAGHNQAPVPPAVGIGITIPTDRPGSAGSAGSAGSGFHRALFMDPRY